MSAFIKAISYYLPQIELTNEDIAGVFPDWSGEKIYNKLGIRKRYIASDTQTASDLGVEAAKNLFAEWNITPCDVDFIILCTQSPDYFLPTTACMIQDRLGLSTSTGALDINLGCSGCVYGLELAKGLILSGEASNVLLITAETYHKYIHPEDRGNLSLFGDAAAAALISTDGFAEIGRFVMGTDGRGYDKLIVKTGASRFHSTTGANQVDEDGHIRRDDYLYMDGSAIFNFSLDVVPDLVNKVIRKNNLSEENIDYYIFHQANSFMLKALRKICSIPEAKFYNNLSETGNTVSSTILIALKDCIDNKLLQSNMNVVLCGFGVGLSWGGTVISII